MNKKIALVSDLYKGNRNAVMSQIPIIATFGDIAYIDNFKNNSFDAFITGYIKNDSDILEVREIIADAKLDNQKVLALIDPKFANDGELYEGITDEHINNYKKLMELSDIITPNFTEACILANMSYEEFRGKYCTIKYENDTKDKVDTLSKKIIETIFPLLDKLRFKKNQITIVTGIELYNAVLTILDVYDGDHCKRQTTCNYADKIENRSGAGVIFDAMFFEACTNGFNLIDALSVSTSFINNALRFSRDQKLDVDRGIVFEPILVDNAEVIRKKLLEKQEEMKKIKEQQQKV